MLSCLVLPLLVLAQALDAAVSKGELGYVSSNAHLVVVWEGRSWLPHSLAVWCEDEDRLWSQRAFFLRRNVMDFFRPCWTRQRASVLRKDELERTLDPSSCSAPHHWVTLDESLSLCHLHLSTDKRIGLRLLPALGTWGAFHQRPQAPYLCAAELGFMSLTVLREVQWSAWSHTANKLFSENVSCIRARILSKWLIYPCPECSSANIVGSQQMSTE